ncbi:MAG TPA: response regulator [Tepidisphaeraceae bacterium]|jgi:PAS domain S-box-containing protein
MSHPPRILILEDSPLDAELAASQLESALSATVTHVDRKDKFKAAVTGDICHDLILSDFELPDFDGFAALKLARQHCPHVPFIFLSGKLGEENAVDALRHGATDYVVKQRMDRLVPVVRRALAEAQERNERLKVEAQLRQSAETFSTLVDRAPFGVFVLDSQLRMYQVNATAQPVFAKIDDLIGRDFAEVMRSIWPTPLAEQLLSHYRRTLDTGEPYLAPTTIDRRVDTGEVAAYEWQIHRVTLPDGTLGVVCYFQDLTEKIRVQDELATTRRQRDAALIAGEIGTYYWDIVGDRIIGDKNFHHMFNVPVDERGYAPLTEYMQVIHPDDRENVARQINAALNDNTPYAAEYRLPGPQGERWVLARGIVERDPTGKPIAWPGVVVDITARKRAEAALRDSEQRYRQLAEERSYLLDAERSARADAERSNRMKEEFLATLSHELRTPLNAILGWSQLLRSGDVPPDLAEGLSVIERNARTQAQLISDLLDMSRIISGKIRLDVQRMDLAEVVLAACETVRHAADAKDVRIRKNISTFNEEVSGDPNRLQQVVWNLLTNAVKFTPRGGHIDLTLQRTGDHIEIIVRDSGEGIAAEFLPYVFDRFRQADGSTTRRHGGLGLGLSIVRQLTELHGGSVEAHSDGLGQGASFIVKLPIAARLHVPRKESPAEANAEQSPVLASKRHHPSYPRLDGIRVLVVDDDADARELLRRLLADCGAEVLMAEDAKTGLKIIKTERPRVLVSDIGMPDHDGYDLIRWIRALPDTDGGQIQAIALTAFARNEDCHRALAAGYQSHMPKPAEPSKLVAMVENLANTL